MTSISIGKARLIQQVAACAIFDLDYPQIGIESALAGDCRVHIGLSAADQRVPLARARHHIETALKGRRLPIQCIQLDQHRAGCVVAVGGDEGGNI